MKLRQNAYSVVGMILLIIVTILAIANVRPVQNQCAWQFPKILSCLLSARETLAAGLIGAGGAIFAAWLAWSAVREQIAADKRREAEGKVAIKRGAILTIERHIEALQAAEDDLGDLIGRFPLEQANVKLAGNAFATILYEMHPAGFRSVQRAQNAPDGLGERVWNRLNGLRMMSNQIYGETHNLSADTKGPMLAAREPVVREAVTATRKLYDDVKRALSDYQERLASARREVDDAETRDRARAIWYNNI